MSRKVWNIPAFHSPHAAFLTHSFRPDVLVRHECCHGDTDHLPSLHYGNGWREISLSNTIGLKVSLNTFVRQSVPDLAPESLPHVPGTRLSEAQHGFPQPHCCPERVNIA